MGTHQAIVIVKSLRSGTLVAVHTKGSAITFCPRGPVNLKVEFERIVDYKPDCDDLLQQGITKRWSENACEELWAPWALQSVVMPPPMDGNAFTRVTEEIMVVAKSVAQRGIFVYKSSC